MGRLAFDAAGVLYGVTNVGGVDHNGTVFSLRPSGAGWAHTVLRRLAAGTDGSRPIAGLALASDGRLYGTTGGVGYGAVPPSQFGTVFRINPDGSGFELLHTFSGDTNSCTPAASLMEAPDGWLYGTAYGGYFCQEMPGWWGSLFRVDPRTGAFETLHTFDRADGGNPWASLLPMADGSLIGSATYAGPLGGGVLFRIAPPRVEPAPRAPPSPAAVASPSGPHRPAADPDRRQLQRDRDSRYGAGSAPHPRVEVIRVQLDRRVDRGSAELAASGPLNGGQGNSLISKLQGALDQLAKGNVTPAINKLEAFVNEVEAFIRSGKLTEGRAAARPRCTTGYRRTSLGGPGRSESARGGS